MTWTSCTTPIVADVIRWTEPIWAPPRKKRGKPDRVGEQLVTAEVIALGEYLQLYVRAVEDVTVKTDGSAREPLKLKIGESIKRKKSTIDRGKTERLLWSDENARKSVLNP